jgi:hypothetical protein
MKYFKLRIKAEGGSKGYLLESLKQSKNAAEDINHDYNKLSLYFVEHPGSPFSVIVSPMNSIKLVANVEGQTRDDLIIALEEIITKVSDGYTFGHDSNDAGEYDFNVTGDNE